MEIENVRIVEKCRVGWYFRHNFWNKKQKILKFIEGLDNTIKNIYKKFKNI